MGRSFRASARSGDSEFCRKSYRENDHSDDEDDNSPRHRVYAHHPTRERERAVIRLSSIAIAF